MEMDSQFYLTRRLPSHFVEHLYDLFKKLDTANDGYIKMSELEVLWYLEHSSGVSTKRMFTLLKKMFHSDDVTFAELCKGMRDALLQLKVEKQRPKSFISAMDVNSPQKNNGGEGRVDGSGDSGRYLIDKTRSCMHLDNNIDRRYSKVVFDDGFYREKCFSISEGLPTKHRMSEKRLDSVSEKKISVERKQTANLISDGLQLVEKMKWWYERKHSKLLYNEQICDLPAEERIMIERINVKLEELFEETLVLNKSQCDISKEDFSLYAAPDKLMKEIHTDNKTKDNQPFQRKSTKRFSFFKKKQNKSS